MTKYIKDSKTRKIAREWIALHKTEYLQTEKHILWQIERIVELQNITSALNSMVNKKSQKIILVADWLHEIAKRYTT